MLTRAELAQWGHDAGEYRATAEQLVDWLEEVMLLIERNCGQCTLASECHYEKLGDGPCDTVVTAIENWMWPK